MDCDTVGLGLKSDPPDIGKKLTFAHPAAWFLREAPKQTEFARMKTKPTVINSAIAMEQIQGDITRFAESGNQCIIIWE